MRKIGDDKGGQNLTLGTIILIVLGVAVLVFLIWGFSTGWGNLWSKVTAYIGGGSNIDDIRSGCELACVGLRESDFCTLERTVKYGAEVDAWNGTDIAKVKSSKGTCKDMADAVKYPGVNVASCPDLC